MAAVMKQRILHRAFQIAVNLLLKLLTLGAAAGKGLGFFIFHLGKALWQTARLIWPIILFFYLCVRRIKARLVRILAPLKGRAFYLLAHRYFVHALLVLIVFGATAPGLFAATEHALTPSPHLPLATLLPPTEEDGEEIIDDLLPAEDLESYLEGRFQDQPPPAGEPGLPLALDGTALLYQELPGTAVPITRTEIVEYAVEENDTPWGIAEKFGVSVSTILWENKLSFYSTIRPGQKLTILPTSGVSHTVKKGETLERIAAQYRADIEEIKQYNKLASALAPGVRITIPGGRPYSPPAPARAVRREITIPPALAVLPGADFIWPTVNRYITQYFKWRHTGVDIRGKNSEDPIYAAQDGVVEIAGWGRGGWGNTVLINHGNGLKTRYAHASKVLTQPGAQVKKGQVIALIGSTGRSTGPHLHFGLYINGRPVNPLQYLKR